MENQVLEFIKKVQSIAQIGLSFSTDPYAIDNYEELRKISIRMLKEYTSLPDDECELYKDFIYPTPQPAVRTLVVRDNKLLLVKEKDSGLWSLPGGWCDIDCTPKETAIKETYEESGYVIECTKLLAVFDRRHYIKKSLYDVYCLYFLGNIVGVHGLGKPLAAHQHQLGLLKVGRAALRRTNCKAALLYLVDIPAAPGAAEL